MATKKTVEEAVEAVETEVKAVEAEVKAVAKKAAPKAKKAVEETAEAIEAKAEKAVKATAAKAKKAAAEKVEEAAEAVEKKAEQVEKAVAEKIEKAAEKTEEKVEQAAKKAEKAVKEGAAKVEKAAKKGKASQEVKALTETPRLKLKYNDEVVPALKEKFQYQNVMQIPKLDKIIINMGLGAEKDNPKGIEAAAKELGLIAGQKVVVTKAKKSVANFKVREGMNIGAKVTLRGDRMYYFADKLMNIVLPRVRDFRGISDKSFDGRGNYAMGLKEQLIFPEINYDDVDKVRGMNIVFVTSAKTDEEAKALLSLLGMPFAQA